MINLKEKLFDIAKNTTVRIIFLIVVLCFIASIFIFHDFYKTQWHKIQGYYYVYKGDKAYRQLRTQDAIYNYKRALELHPKHIRARYNLANLYVAYEDYGSALENYSKALELKPDFMIARIDYTIVLSEATQNYDKAIQEYDAAIKNAPKWMYIPFIIDNKKTYKYNKGVAYYNQGLAWRFKSLLFAQERYKSVLFLKNAVKSYENALKSLKQFDVYYNLAIANHLLRRNYEAGKNYCRAIELEPMNYEAHYNLAILLMGMKHWRASSDEFKKAGLLISNSKNTNIQRYLFDVMNEVNRRMVIEEGYENLREKLDEESKKEGRMTIINGKVVMSEELDSAMLKNFKTCNNKKVFFEGEDPEL